MKAILITGFKDDDNSSKVLLDNIKNDKIDILYLENDFKKSEEQLIQKVISKKYDVIFSFGQKPFIKNIYIEKNGKNNNNIINTNYAYKEIKKYLSKYYKVCVSNNAGNYLCNNLYFKGLKYIDDNKLDIDMLFIHIPYLENIDIEQFGVIFENYILDIL